MQPNSELSPLCLAKHWNISNSVQAQYWMCYDSPPDGNSCIWVAVACTSPPVAWYGTVWLLPRPALTHRPPLAAWCSAVYCHMDTGCRRPGGWGCFWGSSERWMVWGKKACKVLRKWIILTRFQIVVKAAEATFLWDITLWSMVGSY
jgi:hypothetical protein